MFKKWSVQIPSSHQESGDISSKTSTFDDSDILLKMKVIVTLKITDCTGKGVSKVEMCSTNFWSSSAFRRVMISCWRVQLFDGWIQPKPQVYLTLTLT